ncbi:hypothetical protein NDI52_30110 [Leptolyngbya sp. PL-A3]|uniref:hypothetical protein n=1 Tax=Leptolyngbya sp. PL-A3 TaxID=2933911 RepID=UPI0032989A16
MTQPNDAEIKWQAEVISMQSLLSPDHAEYLIQFTNGNSELLAQCEELANRGVKVPMITDWLKVKMQLVKFELPGYQACEEVLKNATENDRP